MGDFGNESNHVSPPHLSLGGNNWFLHEDGIINWSYRRKRWIPIRCNTGKGINLSKWTSELLYLVKGLSQTMFNLELDMCAEWFENPTRGSKDIERARNTVIQCLTLNYDYDIEPTLVKHTHCTSTHHTWHLCRSIWKSHQGFKKI